MAARRLLSSFLAIAATLLSADIAAANPTEPARHHALSLVGDPKFPADFKHFDWVNPNAPRGGKVRQVALGTFDSLNGFSVKGNPAAGVTLIYDNLMVGSPDEPSTEYGQIAEWVSHPDDYSSVTFGLRAEARFHDGKPITPEDVIFSLEALKKANPFYAFYYRNVVKAEKVGEREVKFTFDSKGNRELPQIVGQISVLPKHFWEANGPDGQPRDITRNSLEIPLGSGAYKIKSFDPGRSITYERVKDYWADKLPVSIGQWNFDELEYTYYRDLVPAFEAFKNGDIDFWPETSANRWATQYDFDAVKKGLVRKELIPHKRVASMQAFAFNLRRRQFQDRRVRQAFNLAYDFETANKNLFYGSYARVGSYFGNSELAATGLPEGQELAILNEIKNDVPPEVFTAEWKNSVHNTAQDHRRYLGEASKLLQEAGWTAKDGILTNSAGEQLTAEFLLVQPDFERIVLPYVEDLKRLGVKATVRLVDTSQMKQREDTFDFDIIVDNFPQSHSPGNEQRDFWGSAAADKEGSRNTIGIKSPAIDKLIDKIVFAKDRAGLVAATRALDRVLLWNFYVVPQWYSPADRIAVWDLFGSPEKTPSQSYAFTQVRWFDAAKQKAVATARGR